MATVVEPAVSVMRVSTVPLRCKWFFVFVSLRPGIQLTAGRTSALRPLEREGATGGAPRDRMGWEEATCWRVWEGRKNGMKWLYPQSGKFLGFCPTCEVPTFTLSAEWGWVKVCACVIVTLELAVLFPRQYSTLASVCLIWPREIGFIWVRADFHLQTGWSLLFTDFSQLLAGAASEGKVCMALTASFPVNCPGRSPGLNVEPGRSSQTLGRKGNGNL